MKKIHYTDNQDCIGLAFTVCKFLTLCPDKNDRYYFGRNFDKFWQLFTIFGMSHPDIQDDQKIVKSPSSICTTVHNDDVIVHH